MPCHVTSSLPLQPIDCWSTRPWNRHRVNVRTQLVRSTSLAYSLTISRTRHRHRRRSTGILTSPITHHGRPPSTDLAHHPLTLSLAVTTYFNRAHALCTPTTHATAILIHHDHCLLCRSPKTPPCPSPCHFSSPPQAITTSPLPVPPPLPPPSPPATISTRHQLYQRHLYAIATPPTPRTPPPSPPFGLPPPLPPLITFTIAAKSTNMQHPHGEPVIQLDDPTLRHHHQRTQSGGSFQVEMECWVRAYELVCHRHTSPACLTARR